MKIVLSYNQQDNKIDIPFDIKDTLIAEGLVSNRDLHDDKNKVNILVAKMLTEAPKPQRLESACLSSGAQEFLIGNIQAHLYCKSYECICKSTGSKSPYQFC